MMRIISYLLISFPLISFAATTTRSRDPRRFSDIVNLFLGLINVLIPVVASLALLIFFWGLVKFISNAGDVKTHEDGKMFMIWGIIALFVMVSVWGILNFASGEFGFGPIGIPKLPTN